jgi:hypothetical protein
MKTLFSLIVCFWLSSSPVFAQQDSVYMCPADSTELNFHGLSFPTFEAPETINFDTNEVLWLTQPNNTATLTGDFIQIGHPENGFTADIQLVSGQSWDVWGNQFYPTSYMNDNNVITDEYQDWTYYIIDESNSTLSGFGIYEGSELLVSHAPNNYYYAYQVGVGANQQMALADGHGGWAFVSGSYVNSETGISDQEFVNSISIYLSYECEPNSQSIGSLDKATQQFSFYPNPAVDWVTVQSNGALLAGTLSYTLFDAQGRTVLQGQVTKGMINVSQLPVGSYSILIESDFGNEVLKFLKH